MFKRSGFKVVLFCPKSLYIDSESLVYFDCIIPLDEEGDQFVKFRDFEISLVYFWVCWNWQPIRKIAQSLSLPYIVDIADPINFWVKNSLNTVSDNDRLAERQLISGASGLLCRDLRLYKLALHLVPEKPVLVLPEYLLPLENYKLPCQTFTKEARVAYCGNIEPNPVVPESVLYKLSIALAMKDIEFHVYPSVGQNGKTFSRVLEQILPTSLRKFIFVHDQLPYFELVRELCSASHGISLVPRRSSTYVDDARNNIIQSKSFDYVVAGLSVVGGGELFSVVFPHEKNYPADWDSDSVAFDISASPLCRGTSIQAKYFLDSYREVFQRFISNVEG